MLVVYAVLDEDEPRSATSGGCSVNGFLYRLIVAATISSHHGVEDFGGGLLALHGGEADGGCSHGIAATRGQHTGRHLEGVCRIVVQTGILEDGRLAADNGCNLLAVQRGSTRAGLHLVVKGQDDRAVSTDACGILCRIARHKRGHLGSSACSIGEHEDISQHRTVAAILNAHLRRIVVRDEANINPVLVVSLCRQVELAVLPSTVRQFVGAKLCEVRAIDTIFCLHNAIGIVVIAQSSREFQVLVALRREAELIVPLVSNGLPNAYAVASVSFSCCHTVSQPCAGCAVSLTYCHDTGILRVSHIVSGTIALRIVVIEVPAHDEVDSREVGREVHRLVHRDHTLCLRAVVLPAGKGQNAVVQGSQLHLGTFLIVVYAVHIVALGQELHQILVGSSLSLHVQRIDVALVVGGNERRIGFDVKGIGIVGRHHVASLVGPGLEVVAEVLDGLDGQRGTFVKLRSSWGARHAACSLGTYLDTHRIGGNGLQGSLHVAADDDIAESILLVVGQIVDVDFDIEDVVRGSNAAQVVLMQRNVGLFLGQLRGNALAHFRRLCAADDHHVELTAIGAYAAGIERELFRRKLE